MRSWSGKMTSTAARDAEEGCVVDRKIEHEKRIHKTVRGGGETVVGMLKTELHAA